MKISIHTFGRVWKRTKEIYRQAILSSCVKSNCSVEKEVLEKVSIAGRTVPLLDSPKKILAVSFFPACIFFSLSKVHVSGPSGLSTRASYG